MGVNSRGAQLTRAFLNTPGAVITAICDVDTRAAATAVAAVVAEAGGGTPRTIGDVRKVLEMPDVDALVIAAPDHWHAPAAIMALQAGKHVYVEKPCSHNPREGELLVATQKQHRQGRADGQPAAVVAQRAEGHRAGARRPHRPRLPRAHVVRQRAAVDRQRQAGARAGVARLRPLAGARAASAVPRQRRALRVALALALGHRRVGQQRHAHVRPRALGPAGRAPVARDLGRRPLPLRRRLGVPRHADDHARVPGRQDDHAGSR